MLYTVLKFVHILLAIIGIGFTSTLRLALGPRHESRRGRSGDDVRAEGHRA